MHHLLFVAGRDHAGAIRFGGVLEAREPSRLSTELGPVERDSFLAAAVKEQVGLDLHGVSLFGAGT